MNCSYLMKKRLSAVVMLMVTICLCSCSKDGLAGKKFQGYYHTCEMISLEFKADNNVESEIFSTDFVGNFSDQIYGHYEYKYPNVNISWVRVDSNNDVYKDVMLNPDRIIINESLDTLWLYEKNEEFVLPKYHLYQIDKNAPFLVQVGQYCYQSIFLVILFIIKHFFSIVVAIIILVVFMKWRKERGEKSKFDNMK